MSTKEALADYVRERWPNKTVPSVMAEWDLTDGEARGVVYATATQNSLDKIEQHPRGGWAVILEVKRRVVGRGVEDFIIEKTEREVADARRLAEEAERGARALLGSLRSWGRDRPRPALVGAGEDQPGL